ncbi:hypothetical protein YQE_12245, partial [Dendroctonus ponderosae]
MVQNLDIEVTSAPLISVSISKQAAYKYPCLYKQLSKARYGTNVEDAILRVFQEDPMTSVRVAARRLIMSQWKVRATLNKEKLHPYHYTPVQDLLEEDPLRRMGFCRFMLNADMEGLTFPSRILCTDKSNFNREAITNYHNAHYWT